MRKLFYLLGVISLILFVLSAVHLRKQFSTSSNLPNLTQLHGFEDGAATGDYPALIEKFRTAIRLHTNEAKKNQNAYVWLSFLVTAFSAASTLISAIQAAKKTEPENKSVNKLAILLACITFVSTIANYASTHFNERKTEETKKATDLNGRRSQFFADYDKALNQEARNLIISRYAAELD